VIAAPSSSREQGLRSSSQAGGEPLSASRSSAEYPDMRTTATSGSCSCTRAASSVPRMPGAERDVGEEKVEAMPGADRQQGLLGARRFAHHAMERIEEAAHHGAHFAVVLDEEHLADRTGSIGAPVAVAAGAGRFRAAAAGTASPSSLRRARWPASDPPWTAG
jgi:hypothetical protein